MTAHADGDGRHAKRFGDLATGFLRVETQEQYRSFPFAEGGQAWPETGQVQRQFVGRHHLRLPQTESVKELIAANLCSPEPHGDHAARAEHKRGDLIGISNLSGAKALDDAQETTLEQRMLSFQNTSRLQFLIKLGADPVARELASARSATAHAAAIRVAN